MITMEQNEILLHSDATLLPHRDQTKLKSLKLARKTEQASVLVPV